MPYSKRHSCRKKIFFLNKRKASDKLFCNCRSTQAMFHSLFFARSMPRNIRIFFNEVYSYKGNCYTHHLTLLQNCLLSANFRSIKSCKKEINPSRENSSVQKSAIISFVSEP